MWEVQFGSKLLSSHFVSRDREDANNFLLTPVISLRLEPRLPKLLEENVTVFLPHVKVTAFV